MERQDAIDMARTATIGSNRFAEVIEAVARELVTVDHRGDGSFISTPLIYPSGGNVVVRVEDIGRDEYFVSDYGLGFSECDMMGASAQFRSQAPSIAEKAGVGFDSNAFFVARVTRNQLVGATATIANCSHEAVAMAALKLAEKRFSDDAETLHRRLVSLFSEKHVAKNVEITGASQTRWHVANVVRLAGDGAPEHVTIFEPVTRHHVSIAAAVTKFHDIARLDQPPRRVAVVAKKADFGTYLSVLSQAADVVARDVSDNTIRRLAA